MAKTLFLDENMRREFVFVGVAVDTAHVSRARATMRAMLPRGARRIHFVKENRVRRKKVLAAISSLPLTIVVVVAPGGVRPAHQRRVALKGIVEWALASRVDRIVLERDENNVRADLRTITRFLGSAGKNDALEYGHMRASAEPLLWIADAVAWSWARGGEWRDRVEAMGVTRIDA